MRQLESLRHLNANVPAPAAFVDSTHCLREVDRIRHLSTIVSAASTLPTTTDRLLYHCDSLYQSQSSFGRFLYYIQVLGFIEDRLGNWSHSGCIYFRIICFFSVFFIHGSWDFGLGQAGLRRSYAFCLIPHKFWNKAQNGTHWEDLAITDLGAIQKKDAQYI